VKTLRFQMSVCTAAAALLLTAAGASAQTAPVSGATTGPGVSVPPAGPTGGTNGSGPEATNGNENRNNGSAGEETLGSAFNRELPMSLPRTGGFPMPDPSLAAALGAGLTGAGLYRRGNPPRRRS
jgi:hypothetical protein